MTSGAQWSARTFGNEDRLPRLPLPALEDTCDRFISWCAPLLTAEELAATEIAVHSFQAPDGPGRRLNHALRQAAFDAPSWLDPFWASRYLGQRGRIALDANFFLTLADTLAPADPSEPQVSRGAGLIAAMVDYKMRLDAGMVPPVLHRDRPVSMWQHRFLFSATRIPGAAQDTLRIADSPARHVVVLRHGGIFRLEVIGPDGGPCTPAQLTAGLRTIIDTAGPARRDAVGHLTTQPRASWTANRAALLTCDPGNANTLDTVETALLCVCLEDLTPRDARQACDHLLHGDSANRWFDKSLSLIVFADGTAGVNVERSGLDPATIQDFIGALTSPHSAGNAAAPAAGQAPVDQAVVEPLRFALDDNLRTAATTAATSFAAYAAGTASAVVTLADFGADTARRLGASPDAFVQLACQLAHRRARGMVGASRESIATRHYQHGRTEPMRVVTPEITGFVAAMDDPLVDAVTRRSRFRAAQAKHVERIRQCQAGLAPEQHLQELQFVQQRSGAALGVPGEPDLYRTPGWRRLRDDYLSTGPAYSPDAGFFGFGPAGAKCISVGYVLLPGRCQLYLTARTTRAGQLRAFASQLRAAITELRDLLGGG